MLRCNIVIDLLPTYIDGLVSEETEMEVKRHLQECNECNKNFEQLKVPIEEIDLKTANREINYLKKIKTKNIKNLGIIIVSILLIFTILSYLFVIGSPVKMKDMKYSQTVVNNQVLIDFKLTNGKQLNMKTYYIFDKTSKNLMKVILKPYGIFPSPIYEGTEFRYGYENKQETAQVEIIIQFGDDEVVLVPKGILK